MSQLNFVGADAPEFRAFIQRNMRNTVKTVIVTSPTSVFVSPSIAPVEPTLECSRLYDLSRYIAHIVQKYYGTILLIVLILICANYRAIGQTTVQVPPEWRFESNATSEYSTSQRRSHYVPSRYSYRFDNVKKKVTVINLDNGNLAMVTITDIALFKNGNPLKVETFEVFCGEFIHFTVNIDRKTSVVTSVGAYAGNQMMFDHHFIDSTDEDLEILTSKCEGCKKN